MANMQDYREELATGNAAAPQKLELVGFSEETKVWAWNTFTSIARNLARENRFQSDEWTAMEGLALDALLKDRSIAWDPSHPLTLEQFLSGVIARKLRQAAAKIADERSVWTESRRSLDTPCGSDEGDASLVDLLMDGQTLGANRDFIVEPRAIAVRNQIRRLRDKKDYAALSRLRAKLRGISPDLPEDSAPDGEESAPDESPADVFADDPETLNRSEFDANAHHAQSVAEVGYAPNEDDETPQTTFRVRSASFGSPLAANRRFWLKKDVKAIIATLPPLLRKLCRLMMRVDEPETAYKLLGIDKNDYFKRIRPFLREKFAELSDAY